MSDRNKHGDAEAGTHEALISGILVALDRREQDKEPVEKIAATFNTAKSIGGALAFFAALISGAVLTFSELQAKPTESRVVELIRRDILPLRKKAAEIDGVKGDTHAIRKDIDRVQQVLEYTIERDSWRDDVVDHRLTKKRGEPPRKPESLKRKERKLLGVSK